MINGKCHILPKTMVLVSSLFVLAFFAGTPAFTRTLRVYHIDVERADATLLVSPNGNTIYWSSTTGAYITDVAWLMSFEYGSRGHSGDKSNSYYVRAVPGGQVRGLNIVEGDINCDNDVQLVDGILSLQVTAGVAAAGICVGYPQSGVDVNGDGKIGLEEAIHALQVVSGIRSPMRNTNCEILDEILYCTKTDKSVYHLGEHVEMSYRITNLGDQEVSFAFFDQVHHNFEVTSDNDIIWRRPLVFFPAFSSFVLQPHHYKEYAETWDQMNEGEPVDPADDIPVLPGFYEIAGSLHPMLLENQDQYVPVSVSIEVLLDAGALDSAARATDDSPMTN